MISLPMFGSPLSMHRLRMWIISAIARSWLVPLCGLVGFKMGKTGQMANMAGECRQRCASVVMARVTRLDRTETARTAATARTEAQARTVATALQDAMGKQAGMAPPGATGCQDQTRSSQWFQSREHAWC